MTNASDHTIRRAVFFDRDNTLIDDPGYIADPDMVQLLPGAADAIRMLADAGFAIVVVTNQSGIARGMLDEQQLSLVHERLEEVLAEQGARVDAIYHCPYLDGPEATVARYRKKSTLRKPQPGMLLQAALDLELSLAQSWMVGDRERDVQAGAAAGCRTVLVSDSGVASGGADYVAPSVIDAARIILENMDQVMEDIAIETESRKIEDGKSADGDPRAETAPVDRSGEILAVLEEIRDQSRRRQRDERHDDFSVYRLLGTLTQMLALVAGVWGLMALVKDLGDAMVRLTLAVFLQLVALTAFVAGRKN